METGASLVKTGLVPAAAAGSARPLLDQLYPPVCLAATRRSPLPMRSAPSCFRALRAHHRAALPGARPAVRGRRSGPMRVRPKPSPIRRRSSGPARPSSTTTWRARLVGKLKYGDRPELARFCARLMAQAGHELWGTGRGARAGAAASRRGSSRAATTSRPNWRARSASSPACRSIRRSSPRRKNTPHQVGLSGDARRRNVAGAFAAASRQPAPPRGSACHPRRRRHHHRAQPSKSVTRALKSGGAERVDVVSFARVVTGSDA